MTLIGFDRIRIPTLFTKTVPNVSLPIYFLVFDVKTLACNKINCPSHDKKCDILSCFHVSFCALVYIHERLS